jgi:hypothetical protein
MGGTKGFCHDDGVLLHEPSITTPMKTKILALLLFPLALFGASGTAIPGGSQATTFVINKPGAYYLAANRLMTVNTLPAIKIEVSDVTLDLNGYALSFSDVADNPNAPAIDVRASNIEIRNGSITMIPGLAVSAYNDDGVRLIDLRIADSQGVHVGAESSLIDRCQILDTRGQAVFLSGWGSVIRNSSIRNVVLRTNPLSNGINGCGIYAGSYVEVVSCSIGHTDAAAIHAGSRGNVRNNNIFECNKKSYTGGAITVAGQSGLISGNKIDGCSAAGIKIESDAPRTLVENNTIFLTQKLTPMIGAGIVSHASSAVLRGNVGGGNAGGFVVGAHIDAGGNLGN